MQRLGLLLLAIVVLGGTGWAWQDYSRRIDPSPRNATTVVAAEEPPQPPVVLVIGDSYVGGSAMNSGPTWPTLMGTEQGWIVIRDGVGGTGYVNGDKTAFPNRVQADCDQYVPDVVVLAGGINDAGKYPADQIVDAADKTFDKLTKCESSASIVMLSPFSPASVTPPTEELASALSDLADAEGFPYVEVTQLLAGQPDLVGSDQVHPNDDGHAYLAREIGKELAPLVERAAG